MTALVVDASSAVRRLRDDPAELARHARSYEQVVVPSIFDYGVWPTPRSGWAGGP